MKKLILISMLCVIPFMYGMGPGDAPDQVDTLLEQWQTNSNEFTRQDNIPTRTKLVQYGNDNDDDDPIGVITFGTKYSHIFSACCGGKQGAYIEVLAVAPQHRRKGIAKKLVTQVIEIAQTAPDIDRVVVFISRGNNAAEKLYKQMGFIEEPAPDWAPQQFVYPVD